jgi:hypothetical protein
MSSPKSAAAKTRPKPPARPAVKPAAKAVASKPVVSKPAAAKAASAADASGEATRLAAEIERALADGRIDVLTPQAVQALMSAACKTYAAQLEGGSVALPLAARSTVTPTEVMVTASGLLKAANLAVFELGMWQSWTGR